MFLRMIGKGGQIPINPTRVLGQISTSDTHELTGATSGEDRHLPDHPDMSVDQNGTGIYVGEHRREVCR